MKALLYMLCISVTICLTGCFSIDHAVSNVTGDENVLVRNYGWNLFNALPLVCGNTEKGHENGITFFSDEVTEERVHARLVDYANGRAITNPVLYTKDTVFFDLFGIPIPYILCYREVQISGVIK